MLKLAMALATSVGFVPPSEVPPGQSPVGTKIVVQGHTCTAGDLFPPSYCMPLTLGGF